MSDPMNRPVNTPPDAGIVQRKRASPLLWIVLLIALLAFGWYFYNQRGAVTPPPDTPAPLVINDAMTPKPATSAEREPASARVDEPVARRVADRDAQPIARLQPEYPPSAFRAGEEGTVVVRADIDASGTPTNVEVATRSGSRELDRAAVDAVRTWRFEPATKDGKPVASAVQVPVEFKLDRQ